MWLGVTVAVGPAVTHEPSPAGCLSLCYSSHRRATVQASARATTSVTDGCSGEATSRTRAASSALWSVLSHQLQTKKYCRYSEEGSLDQDSKTRGPTATRGPPVHFTRASPDFIPIKECGPARSWIMFLTLKCFLPLV
jgi:hypothetical protein